MSIKRMFFHAFSAVIAVGSLLQSSIVSSAATAEALKENRGQFVLTTSDDLLTGGDVANGHYSHSSHSSHSSHRSHSSHYSSY
jgi:hypothetical protein